MGSGLERKLDYSDYVAIPDDGRRHEIVRGVLYVTPSPSPQHQRLSKRLEVQLMAYFEERSLGEVFNAPLDVILTESDIVQPDLLVVADPDQVSGRGIERAPLLAVEILSPSTRKHDRELKLERYAELGVRHYWIVDPETKTVELMQLAGNAYEMTVEGRGDATIAHPGFDGLVLDLAALWR